MPYEMVPDSKYCPSDHPMAVMKQGTTVVMGCHSSKEHAMNQMAALYAQEGDKERTMMKMQKRPDDAAGMKAHMMAEPPAGHGVDMAEASMSEMEKKHDAAHKTGGGAEHLHPFASRNAERPAVFERAIPAAIDFELRGTPGDGGMPRFVGYAAMFNVDSEPLPFIETIQPTAFDRSLSNESRRQTFVMDHDETKLLSSRQAKTLTLAADSRGLLVDSELPPTSYARDLVVLHERGEARSMSFTFKPAKGGETWTGTGGERRRSLSEVRLGHVTVLTGLTPAYPQTTASIRSLANRLGAEAEELEETLDAIRDGKPLNVRAVELLDAIVADLREQPAETPIVADARGVSLSVARARLALMSKAR